MADVDTGGFETKGIGLWIEAFGPERIVPWPAFVDAIQVRACVHVRWAGKPPIDRWMRSSNRFRRG